MFYLLYSFTDFIHLYEHWTVWFCCRKLKHFFRVCLFFSIMWLSDNYSVKFRVVWYEFNKCFNISQNGWNICDWNLTPCHFQAFLICCGCTFEVTYKSVLWRGEEEFLLSEPLATCELQVPSASSVPILILRLESEPWFWSEGKQNSSQMKGKLFSIVYYNIPEISI